MRRLIVEEPVSVAAIWSPRLALFAIAVAAIGGVLLRFGRVDIASGFAVLGAGLLIALIAIALAVVGFVAIWNDGLRGFGRAAWGFVLAAALLALPAVQAAKAVWLPALTDVSTDLESPPAFSRSRVALAARNGRTPPEISMSDREAQREAYPMVAPLYLDLPVSEAFDLVERSVTALGWEIVEKRPPGGRLGLGQIEAVSHSLVLSLPYDVTIRLMPRADGSRVDVRSASRIGAHDQGANAERVQRLIERISEEASGASSGE